MTSFFLRQSGSEFSILKREETNDHLNMCSEATNVRAYTKVKFVAFSDEASGRTIGPW